MHSAIFQTVKLSKLSLNNRIDMPPMARSQWRFRLPKTCIQLQMNYYHQTQSFGYMINTIFLICLITLDF
jgi:2,4-dienoyl-CoA reductase-like NADH-dependent reductase (Old Yellow Enzyme family)